jgi:hypothetical protein
MVWMYSPRFIPKIQDLGKLNPQSYLLMVDVCLENIMGLRSPWCFSVFIRRGREPWSSMLALFHRAMPFSILGWSKKMPSRCWCYALGLPSPQNHWKSNLYYFLFLCVGIESRALYMISTCSTTQLGAQPQLLFFINYPVSGIFFTVT